MSDVNFTFLALSKVLGELSEDLKLRAYNQKPKYGCRFTEEEAIDIMGYIAVANNKQVSKDQACKILNMSRATFDRRVAEGSIPKGKKIPGWKELAWDKTELEKLIPHSK